MASPSATLTREQQRVIEEEQEERLRRMQVAFLSDMQAVRHWLAEQERLHDLELTAADMARVQRALPHVRFTD